jgi:hypothetical protein
MLSEFISPQPDARALVLFGKNAWKRDEVIRSLMRLERLTIYGTLSLEEGFEKIQSLAQTDLILIGGRYEESERQIIRNWRDLHFPALKITEPGRDYPYQEDIIFNQVKSLLSL